MLAVDVSPWLRSAAPPPARKGSPATSTAGGKGNPQLIPGWPYSVVAALEPGRTSWTALLDVVVHRTSRIAVDVDSLRRDRVSLISWRRV
jgi:hypothetical protein